MRPPPRRPSTVVRPAAAYRRHGSGRRGQGRERGGVRRGRRVNDGRARGMWGIRVVSGRRRKGKGGRGRRRRGCAGAGRVNHVWLVLVRLVNGIRPAGVSGRVVVERAGGGVGRSDNVLPGVRAFAPLSWGNNGTGVSVSASRGYDRKRGPGGREGSLGNREEKKRATANSRLAKRADHRWLRSCVSTLSAARTPRDLCVG